MQAVEPTESIAISEQTRGPTRVKEVSEPVNVYEGDWLGPLEVAARFADVRFLSGGREDLIPLKQILTYAKYPNAAIK